MKFDAPIDSASCKVNVESANVTRSLYSIWVGDY